MLNLFPIQFLAMFAYLFLRVIVGIIMLHLGYSHLRYRHELKNVLTLSWWPWGVFTTTIFFSFEIIIGIMFIFGAYTQIAALLTLMMSLKFLVLKNYFQHHSIPSKIFYLLLFGASLSLFITGAGALAVDLPI
jgi:uncharacterized membrane protein YphA (DoxX/SURF4 family)